MGLDFSQIYALLKLEPGCSLEEFKLAYRKRVATLHPDRNASRGADDDEAVQLATLSQLYRTAIRFHHTHGRLPGSAAREPSAPDVRKAQLCALPPPRRAASEQPRPAIPAGHWALLAALACLVAYLVLSQAPGERPQPRQATRAATGIR